MKKKKNNINTIEVDSFDYEHSDFENMKAFNRRFVVSRAIGGGSQALVKSAFDRKTKQTVALKIFDKKVMSTA